MFKKAIPVAVAAILLVAPIRAVPVQDVRRTLSGSTTGFTTPSSPQSVRLRVTNACDREDIWINYQVGAPYGVCGTMSDPDNLKLAPGTSYDYSVPDKGLCGFRLWPSTSCGAAGKALGLSGDELDCEIGSSGGLNSHPYCPGDMYKGGSIGCAPPIDSKFEGTFGCTLPAPGDCQVTPQGSNLFGQPDSWDTSLVDGWTLPFEVKVLDNCPGGPLNNLINCSALSLDDCPSSEDLSRGIYPELSHSNLLLTHPVTGRNIGCKAPCALLTKGQWYSLPSPPFNNQTYPETGGEAEWYCCPSTITPEQCRTGPVIQTGYVHTVHQNCKQVYSYSYDDAGSLWGCGAGTRYEVVFHCPTVV